jgi:hypothetical protein
LPSLPASLLKKFAWLYPSLDLTPVRSLLSLRCNSDTSLLITHLQRTISERANKSILRDNHMDASLWLTQPIPTLLSPRGKIQ